MRLTQGGHLTYCMNVHPGETWEDLILAVRTHLPDVKQQLSPDAPLGAGLRLSGLACDTCNGREHELREALDAVGAYAFTVNAFPYGAFHRTRVKEQVYLPDWSDPKRVDYTLKAAGILAAVLPAGMEGSVSTVPLGYKDEHRTSMFVPHLVEVARGLERIYDTTGKRIHVGLEPEPDCILETTGETVTFFHQLFRHPEEALLRRAIGVCLDTCHVALQFEDPATALNRYRSEGILISKLQLSAALEVEADRVRTEDLTSFDDGVYLHQVTSSSGKRWRDLPDWRSSPDSGAGTLRIHCHVPLDWQGDSRFPSTRHTLTPEFWKTVNQLQQPHLEVETYTFDVLPDDVRRQKNVTRSMADECMWVLNTISDLNAQES
jgi:hypothetical protein